MAFTAVFRVPDAQPGHASMSRPLPRVLSAWVDRWKTRMSDRRALSQLSETDLSERGLSRWDLERELARHFWDL